MPDIGGMFPSKYLKASDLNEGEPIVVMNAVKMEPVGQSKEMKAVLYFKGKQKGLVLNKTNANRITKIVGSALTEDWRGQHIRLYATETEYQGETVDCIRVKSPVDQKKPVAPVAEPVKPKKSAKHAAPIPEPEPEPEQDFDPDEPPITDDDIPF